MRPLEIWEISVRIRKRDEKLHRMPPGLFSSFHGKCAARAGVAPRSWCDAAAEYIRDHILQMRPHLQIGLASTCAFCL